MAKELWTYVMIIAKEVATPPKVKRDHFYLDHGYCL